MFGLSDCTTKGTFLYVLIWINIKRNLIKKVYTESDIRPIIIFLIISFTIFLTWPRCMKILKIKAYLTLIELENMICENK